MKGQTPPEIAADLRRAERLEWLTIGWMVSVVVVMALVMGSSQAMRTAWIEDLLSLVPAIVFLIARKIEQRAPTERFPFGYARSHSIAFLISAVALASVGASLLLESGRTLLMAEHVTIAPVTLFGIHVWQGWLMIAALIYSIIPPVILGRMKQPVAQRLQDKVLHTDALMQKADWMTGLAGIAGILGVGLGYWWADAAAAAVISLSILSDGVRALRTSTAELIDGAPRDLEKDKIDAETAALMVELQRRFPDAEVRVRETGRVIHAQVEGVPPPTDVALDELWPGKPERAWRLAQLSFVPAGGSRHAEA